MAKWGKNDPQNELLLQRWNSTNKTWVLVDIVTIANASRSCRQAFKRNGIRHRVWDTGKNEVFCECG